MDNHKRPKAKGASSGFGVVVIAKSSHKSGRRSGEIAHYLGRSLIEHSARVALASGAAEVVVVIDSCSPEARRRLRGVPVRILVSDGRTEGLGDAISAGVAALSPSVGSVIVTLGNRPAVTADHLNRLASSLSDSQTIVASEYSGVIGVPCAFSRIEFPALMSLSGNEGAREFVRSRCTARITFEAAKFCLIGPPPFLGILSKLPASDINAPTSRSLGSRAPPSINGLGPNASHIPQKAHISFALESSCLNSKRLLLSNFS